MLESEHEVIRAQYESMPAQEELLKLILQERESTIDDSFMIPIEHASLLVSEDLCIMLSIDDTYYLAAAAIYSPSNWKQIFL